MSGLGVSAGAHHAHRCLFIVSDRIGMPLPVYVVLTGHFCKNCTAKGT